MITPRAAHHAVFLGSETLFISFSCFEYPFNAGGKVRMTQVRKEEEKTPPW